MVILIQVSHMSMFTFILAHWCYLQENAHFSICETLISAIEQIKCKQMQQSSVPAGQAEENMEGDSDEEIQDLKQRIRIRRRERLKEVRQEIILSYSIYFLEKGLWGGMSSLLFSDHWSSSSSGWSYWNYFCFFPLQFRYTTIFVAFRIIYLPYFNLPTRYPLLLCAPPPPPRHRSMWLNFLAQQESLPLAWRYYCYVTRQVS